MANNIMFLTEEDAKSALNWDSVFDAIKQVMSDVSAKTDVQPPRSIMHMPDRNAVLLTMPGLSKCAGILSCKLVTAFVENPVKQGLPSILANILIFNASNGKLEAVLEGTTITEWRTAAASAVATSVLKPNAGPNQVLAVLGAGRQARIHIIAFQHFFKFQKVNLWNRTYEKGVLLADELKKIYNIQVEVFSDCADCVRNADVLVTATYSSQPIVKYHQIKQGVLINAVGAGIRHHCELDKSIYEKSSIYTDSMENAMIELKGLLKEGFEILGEIGQIINGQTAVVNNEVIIFHSLGMALEDGITASLVLRKFRNENDNKR